MDAGAGERLESALAMHAVAERIFTAAEIASAYDDLALRLGERVQDRLPLVLCVMNGGLRPTAELLARVHGPLELDYVHATRYRGGTSGGEVKWRAQPHYELRGRTVVVVDDIFDEGYTLASIADFCRGAGVADLVSVVLLDKRHARKVQGFSPDLVGLECPDRYVYGAGLDYHGLFRNLPDIFAVAETTT